MPQQPSATRVQKPQQDQSSRTASNKPADKFTDGPIHVSIWENTGAKGAFRVASFELRYRDSEEQWQTGKSYTDSDLLHLEAAAREARSRIATWRQARASEPAPKR